jgi:hypothetical protein
MQNKWEMKRNEFGHVCHPMNVDLGALADTYDQDEAAHEKTQ